MSDTRINGGPIWLGAIPPNPAYVVDGDLWLNGNIVFVRKAGAWKHIPSTVLLVQDVSIQAQSVPGGSFFVLTSYAIPANDYDFLVCDARGSITIGPSNVVQVITADIWDGTTEWGAVTMAPEAALTASRIADWSCLGILRNPGPFTLQIRGFGASADGNTILRKVQAAVWGVYTP